ncbi:membrane integrity-associated transporter subunit PqiC [Rhizobacter sp. OV335]|uniref:PqiC family protein n=1 Tax=Rhizobacter sp. OV335 TaxID=1500264 RepID=UPI00092429A7|nr:PqiC family protein [Rhizobacter sp. OV335]SHN37253.1 hypothetical protein SAMN02787076_05694 [Rhizobacter sp. OV335]
MRAWAKASVVAMAVVVVAMAGCASQPPVRFHSLLAASSSATAASAPASATPLVVELGPVTVPAAVDQPQWVLRASDDSLRVLEGERWVAPLRDELRAAVMARMAERFNAVDARTQPGPASGWRLRIEVQRFESMLGREAWIEAAWSATSVATPVRTVACTSRLHETAGSDPPSIAAAHRRAVQRLADQIGERLRAMDQSATAVSAC